MSLWSHTPDDCPNRNRHREPRGPCEDVGLCGLCGAPTFALRPEGETYGFHEPDCSLPAVHENFCVGGGSGHPPGKIRGYWPGFEEDIRRERERWGL